MTSTAAGEPDGRKILVADDQFHIVKYIQVNLEREGYQILPTYSGEEALEKVRTEKSDLILCDAMMPRMDGFEVLRELRFSPATSDIPFLLLMGQPASMDFKGYVGGPPYLTKPFGTEDLLRTVRAMFASPQPYGEGYGILASGERVSSSWRGTFIPVQPTSRWGRFRRKWKRNRE